MSLGQLENIMPVSVIVSAYADAPYLEETLTSITGQLCQGDELIVFHDGVDEWSITTDYLNGVQYTTYRAGRTLGLERSWSHALLLGKKDYVLWMHHDDLLRDGALSLLKKAAITHPQATSFCGGYTTILFNQKVPCWPNYPLKEGFHEVITEENLAKYLFGPQHLCSGLLMSRKTLNVILPIPVDFGSASDVWLFQHLAFHGSAVYLLDVTVAYRDHSGTETNRYLSNFWGRRAWTQSKARQRADCLSLIQAKGLLADYIAQIAMDESVDVIMDTIRSLIRARDSFAKSLVQAIEGIRPEIADFPGWKRIKVALVLGPWSLEVTGAVEAILRKCKGRKQ